MQKTELCDFGLIVKVALLRKNLTQQWLIEAVKKETGLFLDSAYMSRILRGERRPLKIMDAIIQVLDIEELKKEVG